MPALHITYWNLSQTLLLLTKEKSKKEMSLFFFNFLNRVSCSLGWLQTLYLADDPELLPHPKC